jgi:hypothetical protein
MLSALSGDHSLVSVRGAATAALVCAATVAFTLIGSDAWARGQFDEWAFPRHAGTNHGFPPAADESRERVLRFADAPMWFRLRVAPAKGGVRCFIMHLPNGSGVDGCPRDAATRSISRLGTTGSWRWHETRLLFGTVARHAASVELAFVDGSHATTRPKESFVAFGFRAGQRITRATVRAVDGRVIRRIALP